MQALVVVEAAEVFVRRSVKPNKIKRKRVAVEEQNKNEGVRSILRTK